MNDKIIPPIIRLNYFVSEELKLFCDSTPSPMWFHSRIKGLGPSQKSIYVEGQDRKTLDIRLLDILEGFYYCFGLDEDSNAFISEAEVRVYSKLFRARAQSNLIRSRY